MSTRYAIHPSVGVARLGDAKLVDPPADSEDPDFQQPFFLEPETLGGLPIECDERGNALTDGDSPRFVTEFKKDGCIRRQGARFRVFAYDDDDDLDGHEVTLADVDAISWTVHVANKKPVWFQGSQLIGNLMLGEENSYAAHKIELRNHKVPANDRQSKLIIDPGPFTLSGAGQRVEMDKPTEAEMEKPDEGRYPFISFPEPFPDPKHPLAPPRELKPYLITSLGTVLTDDSGRLVVLGGYGSSCGSESIATFTGADTWFDDTSDGPVTCTLTLRDDTTVELHAWVLAAPPKFAPQLRNISTLDDVMFDVAVREMELIPDLFDRKKWPADGGWNLEYRVSFDDDIAPLMARPADYAWVANVPSMLAFAYPRFNVRDPSEENRHRRERYLHYFRDPGADELSEGHQDLLSDEGGSPPAPGIPLMPVNAGSNPVTNDLIDKMASLTPTQYALLRCWARGNFPAVDEPAEASATALALAKAGVHALDRASVGNCAGHPMSPGWEVTWTTRNPAIYEPGSPYVIRKRYDEAHYHEHGLSTSNEETDPEVLPRGLEPGDLTKRMSSPWQADFYQCSIEYVSFADDKINEDPETEVPPAPMYYAYWWPTQAPMHVMVGARTAEEQQAAGVVEGYQAVFPRGADNIARLIHAWKYMGFIVNLNPAEDRADYPYFVERERNDERFVTGTVAVGQSINQLAASGSYFAASNYFVPVWYLKDDEDAVSPSR